MIVRWMILLSLLALGSCSRGSSEGREESQGLPPLPSPGNDIPESEAEAARFLTQSTFGPHPSEIDTVSRIGYSAWIDWQMAIAPSESFPKLESYGCDFEEEDCEDGGEEEEGEEEGEEGEEGEEEFDPRLVWNDIWWQHALYAPDQLRQRVAFALSEIFVVSGRSDELEDVPHLLADYYDVLIRGAFSNYRDLLEEVTLHPAMGMFLSMVKNQKPDSSLGIRPDENYAREVMQLFSIGLSELNQDGTFKLDANGEKIATYDQTIISGVAHALTGWNFAETEYQDRDEWLESEPELGPMEPFEEFHDQGSKVIVRGEVIPPGQTAREDLSAVLDALANHENVGPFIARRLIQRLVTSHPTPEFIGRVAAVFADDGKGVRGNLGAVVRAILLDPEARRGHLEIPDRFGKVREPILRAAALFRIFDAQTQGRAIEIPSDELYNQAPLQAPSVFNFFLPDFLPPGPLADQGHFAPELQILTHSFVNRIANDHAYRILEAGLGDLEGPRLQIDPWLARAASPELLVDDLNTRMVGGLLTQQMKQTLTEFASSIPLDSGEDVPQGFDRVLETIHMIAISPSFATQR